MELGEPPWLWETMVLLQPQRENQANVRSRELISVQIHSLHSRSRLTLFGQKSPHCTDLSACGICASFMKGLAPILSWTLMVQSCAGFSVSFGVKNVLQLLLIIISPMFQHSPDECHSKHCSERLQSWLPIANIQTKNKKPQHGTEREAIQALAKFSHCWKEKASLLQFCLLHAERSFHLKHPLPMPSRWPVEGTGWADLFYKFPFLTTRKFWLACKYGGKKEKACQWSMYLPLGGTWGALTKYFFLTKS